MMKLLRKHRDWLMIVIAILALPFVFYFVQKPDYGAMSRDQFARIYGRSISRTKVGLCAMTTMRSAGFVTATRTSTH